MTRGRKIRIGAVIAALAITTACSLVVDTDKDQCATDGDCVTAGAICSDGVCTLGVSVDGGDGAAPTEGGPIESGPDCTAKVPVTQDDFLNETCTSAQCIDFDNCTRLGLCGDAALPPLVTPPDGGVGEGGTK